MISLQELQNLCTHRLEDAKTLYDAARYDGAFYICGYVVEMWLKKKICESLGWQGYPSTPKEFDTLKSFRTHDLEILLHLSGIETKVRTSFMPEWSNVLTWNPELRYSLQKQTAANTDYMLKSAERLLQNL